MKVNNITRIMALCIWCCFSFVMADDISQKPEVVKAAKIAEEKALMDQAAEQARLDQLKAKDAELARHNNENNANAVEATEESYLEWKRDQQEAAKQGGQSLQELNLPVAPMMTNDSREWIGGVITVTTDSWASESAWTLLVDWYGDGNLYYVCFEADEYGSCINSGWQDSSVGIMPEDNSTSTITIGMDTDKQYQLVAYDYY